MQLTSIFLTLTLLGAAIGNPLEARTDGYKKCEWECEKYKPKCEEKYKPMYCEKWGYNKSCKDYYEGCDKGKTYCCKYGKCWD